MLQHVDGRDVFVFDIPDKFIALPITPSSLFDVPYAQALTQAIETGLVSKPGKYGIEFDETLTNWSIYSIIEPD